MMNLNRIDTLTGLYTYNVLLEYLEKTVEKASVGILYIELDDPARFNDTFGHDTDKKILVNVIQTRFLLLSRFSLLMNTAIRNVSSDTGENICSGLLISSGSVK